MENSICFDGQANHLIEGVLLEDIDMTNDKWTMHPGAHLGNRPTAPGIEGLEPRDTPVYFRNIKNMAVKNCTARWGREPQPYFSNALQAVNVSNLNIENFHGEAAHPETQRRLLIE